MYSANEGKHFLQESTEEDKKEKEKEDKPYTLFGYPTKIDHSEFTLSNKEEFEFTFLKPKIIGYDLEDPPPEFIKKHTLFIF